MTAALGWGLARSPALLEGFIDRLVPGQPVPEDLLIQLQEHGPEDRGFTDIDLRCPAFHAIVEAKRGWNLPSPEQLQRYVGRLEAERAAVQRIVVLTQNGAQEIVRHRLRGWTIHPPITLSAVGWSDVVELAERARHGGSTIERALATELASYLRGVADMRDTESNRVWVVALTRKPWDGWPSDLTSVVEVEKHRLYHYPSSAGYPKIVPNYIGFRYDGRLRSVHHVDAYEVVHSPRPHVPGAPAIEWDEPVFMLRLGPPIRPDHEVRAGRLYGPGHQWADLDLLLTASTVREAVDQSRSRRAP